ncbi:MAG: hypothetical protein WCL22_04010, partial [bacterium]
MRKQFCVHFKLTKGMTRVTNKDIIEILKERIGHNGSAFNITSSQLSTDRDTFNFFKNTRDVDE